MLSLDEDVQFCRFAGRVPGLVESCCGNGCNEFVVIGGRDEEGGRIRGHRRRRLIRSVDGGGEVRTALGIVLHYSPHDHSAAGRKARYPDPMRIKIPFGGMLPYKADRLAAIFFSP